MARPAKAINTQSRHNTKEEIAKRQEVETKLKGSSDKISPPAYLTREQKTLFMYIVKELDASGILGNLDIFILSTCAIAIDRLQSIEKQINANISLLGDRALMSANEKYTKDLYRCCSELSLSPQARAKIGSINVQAEMKAKDPLLEILNKRIASSD